MSRSLSNEFNFPLKRKRQPDSHGSERNIRRKYEESITPNTLKITQPFDLKSSDHSDHSNHNQLVAHGVELDHHTNLEFSMKVGEKTYKFPVYINTAESGSKYVSFTVDMKRTRLNDGKQLYTFETHSHALGDKQFVFHKYSLMIEQIDTSEIIHTIEAVARDGMQTLFDAGKKIKQGFYKVIQLF